VENVWSVVMRVSPELGLAFLSVEDEEVRRAIVGTAARIVRDRLLAMEGVRDYIGPHALELAELEWAWAVLAHAIEE